MPQKRNSQQEPPKVMTWGKATPVLVVAGIFDAVRFMFEMFWFFGPALAGLYCTAKVSGWVGTLWGLVPAACGIGAIATGVAGSTVFTTFGIVMAMAVGFAGWLTVGLILLITNARIFKENVLWFGASLLVSEVPIIGAIPALTITVWRMYSTQIRLEKAEMKKWKKENAAAQLQERKQREAERMQFMQNQAMQQQATNDEAYNQATQQEAANDEQYTQKLDAAA